MTIEQITAINNAMSMLSDLPQYAGCANSIEQFKEYINEHIKALKNSGVDNCIVEHYKCLCDSWMPIVRDSVAKYMRWADINEEFSSEQEWEWLVAH